VLKLNKIKTIREINKLKMDVDNAITLLCFRAKIDLLFPGIADIINIPIKGINNKDISNMIK